MRIRYLVLLAATVAVFSAEGAAQPYSPGAYRAAPMEDDADAPPAYVAPPPLPRAPLPQNYEVQPLPPPGAYAPPPPGAYLPPPSGAYPQPPASAYPPPGPAPAYRDTYVHPSDERGPSPQRYGPGFGWQPIRPPAEIQGPRAAPGYPPSAADGPTGSISSGRAAAPAQTPPPAPSQATAPGAQAYAALPPDYRPEEGQPKQLSPHLQKQMVDYATNEPAGTLIIDTPNTFLYLVLGNGKAMRYGIGVGREGFTWSGVERISKMAEWPDWHPPKEMIERQPYLPRFMAGGESNPLGARALYLGNTIYRIHGTNQPSTIGTFVSSGCIRLTNPDVQDLFGRVNVGTRVVVLPGKPGNPQGQGPGTAQLPSSSQVIR